MKFGREILKLGCGKKNYPSFDVLDITLQKDVKNVLKIQQIVVQKEKFLLLLKSCLEPLNYNVTKKLRQGWKCLVLHESFYLYFNKNIYGNPVKVALGRLQIQRKSATWLRFN